MKSLKLLIGISVLSLLSLQMFADVNPADRARSNEKSVRAAGCEPAKTSTDLYVNNVKTRIHTGGDMWWDLQGKAKYEVPAGAGTHALFAGSIWVGGKDANGQLKLAAMRFRQVGIDYWPGPLITSGAEIASVTQDICREYDEHFYITKEEVDEFRNYMACQNDPECNTSEEFGAYSIPDIILNWPAHGPAGGYDYYLAPFWDVNDDGYYNPYDGDFPYYEYADEGITDDPDCIRPRDRMPKLFGDETMWWIYNDKGNIHTETGGEAIGMEFRAQAFAFATNDELNDMTFYNYNIINRSTYTLYETFFGVWTDADLGGANDDYVGCDVQRGLGYCYNGDEFDADDSGNPGYGNQPPAIGIDFFEGPYQDPDGLDNSTSYDTINGVKVLNCDKGDILNGNINGLNYQDGTVDNERWGMRRFLYFNNSTGGNPATTDPNDAIEYYNYLTGFWKDNTPLSYGGTGHYSGGASDVETDFMFPGDPTTDPCGWGQGGIPQEDWSEETESNPVDDRRFVQSAGPFTLTPGAVNDITIGAVYGRAASGGAWASVESVKKADDKAQILFENCFRVLNGPDAPELKIVELDKKLIFQIYNEPSSNNYLEQYVEKDPSIICFEEIDPCDEYYRFQGYQVFQLINEDAGATDRYNEDLVREVFQCDVKDDIDQIVNYTFSDELAANVPVEEVNGKDEGIVHSFEITEDLFALGDKRLINHREYYFTVLAYGYNNSMLYNQQVQETFNGQKKPYLAGRNNIEKYEAIPHISDPGSGGTILQSEYGYGPEITQVEGLGNGNNALDLKQEVIDQIMAGAPWKVDYPTYENGRGPIDVKVIDPLSIPQDSYTFRMKADDIWSYGLIKSGASWELTNSEGKIIYSDYPVNLVEQEQLLLDYGFSIKYAQVEPAGYKNRNDKNNGFIEASLEYADDTKPWLNFIADGDGQDYFNWIRLGTYQDSELEDPDPSYDDYIGFDPDQNFEKILGGTWAPYIFTSKFKYGPAYDNSKLAYIRSNMHKYYPLSSVDIVLTPDKDKWSRAIVLEMCENEWTTDDETGHPVEVDPLVNYRSEGEVLRFDLRQHASIDKDGNVMSGDTTHGLGWFPGYAIDVRTGERLNIAYGEDSWLAGANGNDLIWNPTNEYASLDGAVLGGKHFIYVYGSNSQSPDPTLDPLQTTYDESQYAYSMMRAYEETGDERYKIQALSGIQWTAMPVIPNRFELLDTEVKIKIRIATPYYEAQEQNAADNPVNNNLPMYTFNTDDIKTIDEDVETAESALDLIRVVPNPYYGHSYYENTQLDNTVRITNLPQECTITIYNVSGRKIRQFSKDNDASYIDWDLKNSYNISIASGMYIVHVNAPGVGEKVVKWFGSLRPIDLQNF
ncbi:MAG: T9SS type A sorting domain-containing protein [Bacteroidota bacterium]|nr:T9SS type A sorting domain-containing protein [Bacteroidota bacterium]